ncbi:MAG: ATP-dependent helicase [Muribaculaceae bacterium]|nr:ATP-dependent helicase [Muribaculaceae bacterium]
MLEYTLTGVLKLLIEGSLASNKTDILIEKYAQLLNSGVKSSEILVLVQNSTLKNEFLQKTFEKLTIDVVEKMQVHSFFSLVYNTVSDNWAFLEDRNIFDNPVILPNLAGLEVSQFILKDILNEVKFRGYNSRMSLLHQIFRRYSLIIQNNLSASDVQKRAEILKEGFSDEADLAIKKLMKKTLELRDFDYLRQCSLFNFIYKNTDYFKNIKYLFVDDADECTPICVDFFEYLSKQLEDFYITFDSKGSSRCGYLSADKNNFSKLKSIFKSEVEIIQSDSKLAVDAENIFKNIYSEEQNILQNFSYESLAKRSSMVDSAVEKNNELINKKKVSPSDIVIISPVIDDMLKFSLRESLKGNITPVFLSGSEKLIQNRLVQAAVTILKLNTELKNYLSEFDIRVIISEFLQIPLKYCEEILLKFQQAKELVPYVFADSEYTERYNKFLKLVERLSVSESKISEQIVEIYDTLFDFGLIKLSELKKFNFFIKQITDFENIFGKDFNKRKSEIILQIENSIIAENPYSVLDIARNDLIVSTPQKIIDNHIKSKYQIWLDVSSSEWIKSDTGPLYNAWVFQKDWYKDEYTVEDNIELSKDKNARVLRKLTLCAAEKVFCYSSLFDSNGVENYGGIESSIVVSVAADENTEDSGFKITPRDDQKPVLDYRSGYMGISAVPGAGKTTILLALIIKLLERGINPERIFVLTYMDSAARNFRERIKNVRKNSSKLPNISTIHGLALRILKENGNFEKLGLSSDFEICDDSQRGRILREIASKLKIEQKLAEEFDRAVSVFKIGKGQFPQIISDVKLKKFKLYFESYVESLKEFNLIDYDDMLTGAVRILKENPDILSHYQEICEYIIEDEAQDSSSVQQELIALLSGKYKNIIRCGDVNQSITATFSNADVEGFRRFITENYNVSMNCSQRCTKDVWSFANLLVENSLEQNDSKNAFFKMLMAPVEGRNPKPDSRHCVCGKVFDSALEEKNYVLKIIKDTLAKHPDYTVGILLRNNYQVAAWQDLIENSGLKVITRNACLEQKSIFKVIFAVMKIILTPFDNETIASGYEILSDSGFYKRGFANEIRKYENPFIQVDSDNIGNIALEQFYWDLNCWVSLCYLTPDELAVKIGMYFFKSAIEKSNIHLISTLIKRICIRNNSLEYAMDRLSELSKKPNLSGFKFFSEEDEDDKSFLAGKVQIMTMHKSKGDEFNLVFLPEMTEKNMPLTIDAIGLKSSEFIESVKNLNPEYTKKSEYEIKKEILEETLRLLYVAITRAKNRLFFTVSSKIKTRYGKEQKNTPSSVFDILGCAGLLEVEVEAVNAN